MKNLYPTLPFESSCFFATAAAASLVRARATIHRYPASYIKPSPFVLLRKSSVAKANVEKLMSRVLGVYDALGNEKFDFLVIGSGSGASANFCGAMHAPLLPVHTMVVKLQRMDPDDMQRYADETVKHAKTVVKNNDGIEVVIHQDPIHDRPFVSNFLIIRMKFTKLLGVYKSFIEARLKKGGTLVFLRCSYPWKWYKLADKIWFQLGGYGDIGYEEYANGSDRIDRWLERVGEKHHGGWGMQLETETKEESEWGTNMGIEEDAKRFCEENGYNFMSFDFKHPCDCSLLASYLWNEKNERSRGFMLDTFWTFSPTAAKISRYIPYWAPWPDEGTLKVVDAHVEKLKELDAPEKVIFGRHPAFGPDIAGISTWKKMLERHFDEVKLCGHLSDDVDSVGIIEGAGAITDYIKKTTKWAEKVNGESGKVLTLDDLKAAAKKVQ